MSGDEFDSVLINGSVGAGKSTTADRLGEELERRGVPGAVIDVDELRRSWPAPNGDPFREKMTLANLRAVAGNYRAGGAQVIVAAGVVESIDELARSADALAANRLLHVRLTIAPDAAVRRLRVRHGQDLPGLEWHEHRHPELAHTLERAGFADEVVIDTTRLTVEEVARSIADHLRAAGDD